MIRKHTSKMTLNRTYLFNATQRFRTLKFSLTVSTSLGKGFYRRFLIRIKTKTKMALFMASILQIVAKMIRMFLRFISSIKSKIKNRKI